MSAHGVDMAGNAVKIEPVDEVEEKPNVDMVWLLPSSAKEEIDIGPTVIQPVEQKCALRQYKRKPVKQEPLQISRTDTVRINKNEHEPGSSSRKHCCTICNDNFNLQSALDVHIAECHALSLCCNACKNISKGEYALKKEAKTFSCEYCNKLFLSVFCMERHQRLEHSQFRQRLHKCEICNKSFLLKMSLIRHSRKLHTAFARKKCSYQRNIKSRHPKNNGCHYCSICNRTLSQKNELYVHMLRHTKRKAHFCKICKQAFSNIYRLKQHQILSKHTDESLRYCCNICGQASFTRDSLIEHMCTHIGEQPFYCNICKKSYPDTGLLEFHILSKHSKRMSLHGDDMKVDAVKVEPTDEMEEKPDVDSVWLPASSVKEEIDIGPTVIQPVDQKFALPAAVQRKCALRQYKRKPVKQKPLQISRADTLHIDKNEPELGSSIRKHCCTICNDTFHLQSALDVHIAECHALKTYSCDYCNKIFSRVHCMKRHQRIQHNPDKLHKCENCNKSFELKKLLKKHMRKMHNVRKTLFVAHGEQTYHCNICKKIIARANELYNHVLNHNEKSYFCGICKNAFACKKFLLKHNIKFQHHDNNGCRYCSICNIAFSQGNDLYLHMRRHTRIKSHFCNICKKAFANIYHLKLHQILSKHTDESLQYHCNVCGQASFMRDSLIEHMCTHIGNQPFYCGICKKLYRNNGILELHILSKHSKIMSAHGHDMKADAVKVEPTDEVEEKPDVDSIWLPASSVKEEIDIGPTMIQPVDQKFALRQYKRKPIKQEPLQISRAGTLHIDKNEPEPCSSSREHHCMICNDSFHLQSALDIHTAECHGLSLCCQYCKNIYSLKKEAQTYSCDYCNKIFLSVFCMERHRRFEHNPDKPHKCDICNKSFQHKTSIIGHKRRMHNASASKKFLSTQYSIFAILE